MIILYTKIQPGVQDGCCFLLIIHINILPGHPNVLEKSTSPPFRTTFEQIEQK